MKELGVDGTHFNCLGNQTYSPVLDNETEIVEKHCRILQDKFGIIVKDVNKKLPRIFWNPKLHKVPYKARFIAGATKNFKFFMYRPIFPDFWFGGTQLFSIFRNNA